MESYFGRKVAVDASMSIYQFLIAMQNRDGSMMLTNDAGEVTSHLQGLMNRTAKMLECGIKPAYVFDGKPPDLKKGTLDDRKYAIIPHVKFVHFCQHLVSRFSLLSNNFAWIFERAFVLACCLFLVSKISYNASGL